MEQILQICHPLGLLAMKCVFLFCCCLLVTTLVHAQSTPLEAYWDDGLRLRSRDSAFRFSLGGRVHYDIAFSNQSAALGALFKDAASKVEVRRARLSFEGQLNNVFAYEFEFTFREQLEYADMSFSFLRVPLVDRLTVGYFREPFGMEENTSSNAIVFMERSLTSSFAPGRNTGLMVQKGFLQNKLKGYAGVYRLTDDLGADLAGKGNHSFSTRWAYAPLAPNDNNHTLHLGLAFNRFTPDDSTHRVESENEVNTSPTYLTTGDIKGVRTVNQIGTEAGFARGPLCLQAEWIGSFATRFAGAAPNNSNHLYQSYYVTASYFFKGARQYSTNGNRFSTIKLERNRETGRYAGAWEAALRFSHLDLRDAEKDINRGSNITAGLNWYFNSNTRLMVNYVQSFFNGGLRANTFQMRMQATF
jgi:phosphate-selective porin OprO and OprP